MAEAEQQYIYILQNTLDRNVKVMENLTTQMRNQGLGSFHIECFEGNVQKFREWVDAIEKYSIMNKLTDEEKINVAFRTSKGAVSDFILKWQSEGETNNIRWDQLREELAKRFSLAFDIHGAKITLNEIRQFKDESIVAYSNRVRYVVTDVYSTIIREREALEREMLQTFTSGLRDRNLQDKIITSGTLSFEKAIQIAHEQQNKSKTLAMFHKKHERETRMETPMEIDHNRKIRCRFCNKFGHYTNQCRERKEIKPSVVHACDVGR